MRLLLAAAVALAGLLVAQESAQAEPQGAGLQGVEPVHLVPHRAVYDLSLARSSGPRSVESARGRIAFDFTGNDCKGYTMTYRQVTVTESSETGDKLTDIRTNTFESGDAKVLRFRNETITPGSPTQLVQGDAERRDKESVAVRLRQPRRDGFALPGHPVFPTEQMKLLVEAARAGRSTVPMPLFDGSDNGRKVYETLAVIGKRIAPGAGEGLDEASRQPALAKLPRWPVALSYYGPDRTQMTPIYILSFELFDNGVSRALRLDYGDFTLRGDLRLVQMLPETPCKQ